jgi:hypothetical protein
MQSSWSRCTEGEEDFIDTGFIDSGKEVFRLSVAHNILPRLAYLLIKSDDLNQIAINRLKLLSARYSMALRNPLRIRASL